MSTAEERAEMPEGSAPILDKRTLEKDYRTLVPLIQVGMRILDVGCGSGAISRGLAERVGPNGFVWGIDSSDYLIESGQKRHADIPNLRFTYEDLFAFAPAEKFDLIVSARVLQWLDDPKGALQKFKTLLKPEGMISILDYDHTALEWTPAPPASMKSFYAAFLQWRAEAGMNNQIARDLPAYFEEIGMREIEVFESNEVYQKGAPNFPHKIGIWSAVAQSRGQQVVADGYFSEADRLKTIEEYDAWAATEAQMMVMKLREVRGKLPI
ncbi:MAG: methyltransferase domain-containing protein [Bacteroidota bacterium]